MVKDGPVVKDLAVGEKVPGSRRLPGGYRVVFDKIQAVYVRISSDSDSIEDSDVIIMTWPEIS